MRVVIAGAGIGGLTAALALDAQGIEVQVYETTRDIRPLGVGINLLPHAMAALDRLGLLDRIAALGVPTAELCFFNRHGQLIWREPRGLAAGYPVPQISLHRGQRAPRAELTARVVEAMRHPAARCLSHPTGRLLGHRPENALDLERTVEVALETGVALEVNGLANRLDLPAEGVRLAVEAGARIVCSTDAHSVRGLEAMELSVHTARRGRASAQAVLNTRDLAELLAAG